MEMALLGIGITAVISVMGYLLAAKDTKQAADIETLFKLCHSQQAELAAYKLKIAENHYPKHELDQRFQQLNNTIDVGFKGLSQDVKEMTKTMHEHFKEHHTGGH